MTQDKLFDMAREAGFMQHLGVIAIPNVLCLERFAALVAKAEREACAKLCDSSIHDTYIEGYTGAKHSARRECAAAIRARGQE